MSDWYGTAVRITGLAGPPLLGGVAGGVIAYFAEETLVAGLKKSKWAVVVAGICGGIGAGVLFNPILNKAS
jgi:hypothetical protein